MLLQPISTDVFEKSCSDSWKRNDFEVCLVRNGGQSQEYINQQAGKRQGA